MASLCTSNMSYPNNEIAVSIRKPSWSGYSDDEMVTKSSLSAKPSSASERRLFLLNLTIANKLFFVLCVAIAGLILLQQRWDDLPEVRSSFHAFSYRSPSTSLSKTSDLLPLGAECRSDESCGPGNACVYHGEESWRISERPHDGKPGWSRVGTCTKDNVCTPYSCNSNGACVVGQCTCNFGWKGEKCEKSSFAFATLLYGALTSTKHMFATTAWAKSIRNAGSKEDIIVAVTPEVPETVREELRLQNLIVREISSLPLPESMASPFSRTRWSSVFSKFMVYGFTEYSKVAVMDTDIVLNPSRNPSDIFAACNAEACGVNENWGSMFFKHINGGVMVLKPSQARLEHVLDSVPKSRDDFALPEQMWIVKYSEDTRNEMSLSYIDSTWNNCGSLNWSFDAQSVLHFCGPDKPINIRRIPDAAKLVEETPDCLPAESSISIMSATTTTTQKVETESTSSSAKLECGWKSYIKSVAAFQDVVVSLDSCFAHTAESSCSSSSLCNWHGTFCATSTSEGNGGSILSRIASDSSASGVFSSAEIRKLSAELVLV